MSLTSEATTSMTLGQFMEEAELFTVSKEYFDMMKESSEVCLLEQYLACQEYLLENSDDIDDDTKAGLITESTDNVEQIYESMEEKKAGLWSKIKAGVKKVLNALVTFISRLLNFWKNGKELENLRAEAAKIGRIKDENIEAATNLIKKIMAEHQAEIDKLKGEIDGLKKSKAPSSSTAIVPAVRLVPAKTVSKELAIMNSNFKAVPDIFSKMQTISSMLEETVTIQVPKIVGETMDKSANMREVMDAYKLIRYRKGASEQDVIAAAKKIEGLLNKLKSAHTVMIPYSIGVSKLQEAYDYLLEAKKWVEEGMENINLSFANSTKGTAANTDDESATNQQVRAIGDTTYQQLQNAFTNTFSEWIFAINTTLKTLKEIMDMRVGCQNTEKAIVKALTHYGSGNKAA